MTPIGVTEKDPPLNDSLSLCIGCNLSITDDSYIFWKGVERVCLSCRNSRIEQLRKTRQEEIKRAEKRTVLNVSALKTAASAAAVQLKTREKWGHQMIYLEATFSNGARTQLVRYFFANDIPIYIPSWSGSQTLYLRDVTEIGTRQRECHDCGRELEPGEGIKWNYTIRLCHECHSERRRTMKFGFYISPSKPSSEISSSLKEDSPGTRAIKLVAADILRAAGGGMGITLFNQKMQKMGYPPDVNLKALKTDPRFSFIKSTVSKIVDGKIVRKEVGDIVCIGFREEEQ
jgi:hypothetical protein